MVVETLPAVQRPAVSGLLWRWGRLAVRRRGTILHAWIAIAAGLLVLSGAFGLAISACPRSSASAWPRQS